MGVPGVPLAELYEGCKGVIEAKGGEVNLRTSARGARVEGSAIKGVKFDGEREESADAYVFAVPHTVLPDLIPGGLGAQDTTFRNLRMLKDAPITGVHLWFDREVITEPFVTLLDTTTQWIFNKTALYGNVNGSENSKDGQYLQLVVSASYDLLQKPRQEIDRKSVV